MSGVEEPGPGAGRTVNPDIAVVTERIAALQLRVTNGFAHIEQIMDERREADQAALVIAKETLQEERRVAKISNDAIMENHNQLIKQMREQAQESQRQLDKLTDTYATKKDVSALDEKATTGLTNLEKMINRRLSNIEDVIGGNTAGRAAVRSAWADLKGIILIGIGVIGILVAIATYLAQSG